MRSETCTPRWVDSAMTGPAAIRATAEGSSATRGASRDRKVRNSRAMMNSTDSTSVSVWVCPFWFCWSTDWATPPVRWRARPGGAPAVAMADRRSATDGRLVPRGAPALGPRSWRFGPVRWPTPPGRPPQPPWAASAWPARSGRWPGCRRGTAIRRAAATRVAVDVVVGWKGAASSSACTLAALEGRNWELLLFSTLDSEGRRW